MGHTSTTPSTPVDVASLDRQHRRRGFLSFRYHYLIDREGRVKEGRHKNDHGAGSTYYNEDSVYVVLAGGINLDGQNEDNFTTEQKQSLNVLTSLLFESYPDASIHMSKGMEFNPES